jgi:hypothetical protein
MLMPDACSGLTKLEDAVHFWVQEVALAPEAARALLLAQPHLIYMAPATLRAKLEQLRVLLEGSPWSAEEMVAGSPTLLGGLRAVWLHAFLGCMLCGGPDQPLCLHA